jgi:hypothetical protein
MDGEPVSYHKSSAFNAIAFFALLAILIAFSGCAEQPSVYGADQDTARGTCDAKGAVPVTHFSHGGWTSDCSEALSE